MVYKDPRLAGIIAQNGEAIEAKTDQIAKIKKEETKQCWKDAKNCLKLSALSASIFAVDFVLAYKGHSFGKISENLGLFALSGSATGLFCSLAYFVKPYTLPLISTLYLGCEIDELKSSRDYIDGVIYQNGTPEPYNNGDFSGYWIDKYHASFEQLTEPAPIVEKIDPLIDFDTVYQGRN